MRNLMIALVLLFGASLVAETAEAGCRRRCRRRCHYKYYYYYKTTTHHHPTQKPDPTQKKLSEAPAQKTVVRR